MMSRMSASTRFYSLKMREGEPVDQFVASFRLLKLKLAQTGTVIKEKDAVLDFCQLCRYPTLVL